MKRVREDVLQAAQRAALRELEPMRDAVQLAYRKAHAHSSTVLVIAGEIERSIDRAATSAANTIAEVEMGDAVAYADALGEMLSKLGGPSVKMLTDQYRNHAFADFAKTSAADLEIAVARRIAAVVSDLKVGLAGGVNVDKNKSRIVAIHQNSGQVIVDSPGAKQSVGRDLRTELSGGIDPGELLALLQSLQAALAEAPLATSDRDALEDAVVGATRELQDPDPKPQRLKRLLGIIGSFSEKVAASAAGGIVAKLVAIAAQLPA